MKTRQDITVADISGASITIPAGTRTTPAHNLPLPADGKRHRWVVFGRWATPEQKRRWKFGLLLTHAEVQAKPKTLADFAPEMLIALRSLVHPMASEQDLQDAVELLDAIDAARKAASDAAFIAAALPR
jgi:hypothetical protein